ncbi:hypothetical protein ACXZ1M_20510 [Duganella sp. PWIR1]
MMHDYELYQLRLILAEYEANGYTVIKTESVKDGLGGILLDGLVERSDPPSTVIIELVNAHRLDKGKLAERAELIQRLFGNRQNVSVDFRYIDNRTPLAAEQANHSFGKTSPNIGTYLKAASPGTEVEERKDPASAMLLQWHLIAGLIRVFAKNHLPHAASLSVLEIYNMLLMSPFNFKPAERFMRSKIKKNLFDLRAEVDLLLEGGTVGQESVRQLATHLKSLQDQMSAVRSEPTQKNDGG